MKEDILTLKQGQKPAGVDVPRKVEAPAQVAPQSPKPTLPSGGQPSQGFKMPTVNLGQAEKTGPLPQEKRFTSSVPTPPTPVAPPVLEPKKSQIYVPPTASSGISGGGNSRLFMLIAGIAVIFGIFYWFLVLREPTVEMVEETPTPTATSTPILSLSDLFPAPKTIVTLAENKYSQSLKTAVDTMIVGGGSFSEVVTRDIQGGDVSWMEYLSVPQQVQDALKMENIVLVYGQKEIYSQNGQLNPSAPSEERLVVIVEAKDASFASQGLGVWEPIMVADLQELFTLNPVKQSTSEFMNTSYRGTAIKYKNFPNPDRSIDYGIVSAKNGKSYMVITNSRESMFAVVDALKGFAQGTPTPTPGN